MTPSELAFIVGAIIGGGFLLVVVGWFVVAYLRAGRDSLQRRHQKAVRSDLKTLKRTQRAAYNGESVAADLQYLCAMVRPASRRARWRNRLTPMPGAVAIRGCPGEDAEGQRYYLASIDGTTLAHRDLDALVEDAERVADAKLHNQQVPGTLSEYYAQELIAGRVDYAALERSVRGDCLTRLQSNLRRNDEVDLEDLWERFVYDWRYPPNIVREKIEQIDGRDARQTKEGTLSWQRY